MIHLINFQTLSIFATSLPRYFKFYSFATSLPRYFKFYSLRYLAISHFHTFATSLLRYLATF